MNRTLLRTSVVFLAVSLLVQGTFVGILGWFHGRYAEARRVSRHANEALDLVREIDSRVMEGEADARGYVLTGDPALRGRGVQADDVGHDADRLVELVADNPAQQDGARRVAAAARRAVEWQAELVRMTDSGRRADAAERIRQHEGIALLDAFRTESDTFVTAEERLGAEREADLDRLRQTLNGLLVGGAAATLALIGGLALLIGRGIGRRLALLADNAGRLAAGQELAEPIAGTDDIARADQAVHRVAAEVRALRQSRTDRANAPLQVEEAGFRSAFEDTNVAMVLTDLTNRFVRANVAFARLFGYSMDEVLELTMADVTHPDDVAESLAQRQRLLAGATNYFQLEKRYRRKNGQVLWGLTNVSLVRDADGRPLMYVGQVQDITERRRAEGAVRDRTAELTEANRELALKNQENELFVYSVSHDLRGPLVNLQGFSKELQKAADALRALFADSRTPLEIREAARTVLDQKVTKALGFIQSAVARLGGIIDALLRLSRAGRVEYRWERVDMNRLVGQLLGSVQATIVEKRATVGAGNLPPAFGDATALGQVFANLVGNALAYLDPARPGRVEVGSVGAPEGSVTYVVKDNGLGIPAAYQAKVFQLFQRAHPEVGAGEGLGLAIVARVVERHRGRVWVESVEGEGSTFYVQLPAPPAGPGDES